MHVNPSCLQSTLVAISHPDTVAQVPQNPVSQPFLVFGSPEELSEKPLPSAPYPTPKAMCGFSTERYEE
jgi:hypothetical protein